MQKFATYKNRKMKIFGWVFGILTKEKDLVWFNAALILFVIELGLLVGYLWSQYSAKKAKFVINKKSSPL